MENKIPCGKEEVIKVLEGFGRYIHDDAEKIWNNEIEGKSVYNTTIQLNISHCSIPSISINKDMNLIVPSLL